MVDVVRRADAVDRVCLGSFGRRVLRAARAIEPAIATSARARRSAMGALPVVVPLAGDRASRYGGYQVPEMCRRARASCRRASSTTRTAPASACRCGRWTREDAARRLLGWGVDALITDRPDIIVPLVARCRESFNAAA